MTIIKFNRFFFLLFFFFISFDLSSKNLVFKGNDKLTLNDLKNLTSVDINEFNLPLSSINTLITDLYKSDLISEVSYNISENTIEITIIENSIIENIYFNGNVRVKNKVLNSNIESKINFYVDRSSISSDITLIKNIYRSMGFLNSSVVVSTEKYSDNRVNLIFEIDEGTISKISDVNFIGNESFSDKFLYSKISTKSLSAYNIFTSGSNFVYEAFSFDQEKLINYYKRKGFFDIDITYQLKENNFSKFELIYFINEGDRYLVDNIEYIYNSDKINDQLFSNLNNKFTKFLLKNNNFFDYSMVDDHIEKLNQILIDKGYFDKSFTHLFNKTDDNINLLTFELQQLDPNYIKKISITGNSITKDETIRSKINIEPGDYLNSYKIDRTEEALNRLKYINKVKIYAETKNNISDLIIELDENKKTGNFLFGGSYSGDTGAGIAVSLKDSNFLGKGTELNFQFSGNQEQALFNINYNTYSLYNSFLTHHYSISNEENDLSSSYGYKTKSQGIGYGIGLRLNDKISTSSDISIEKLKGYEPKVNSVEVNDNIDNFNQVVLKFNINYDSTDDIFFPTNGLYSNFNFSISPENLSDDSYFKIDLSNKYFKSRKESDNYFFFINNLGIADGLGTNLKTINSFSLGGLNFKGFDYRGIGPLSENNIYLGGNKFITSTIGYGGSFIFDEKDNVNARIFYTNGSLWASDYSNNNKFNTRSSIGLSLDFLTVVGPLSLSYAIPIQIKNEDTESRFNFTLGASF